MFCLLPPTRLALGSLPEARVPDASALFNLMRNLGGAIGLALIDTIVYGRAAAHGAAIAARAASGDPSTLLSLGLPAFLVGDGGIEIGQRALRSLMEPRIAKLALVETINVAWAMIFCLTLLALLALPFARGNHATPRA
jgi:DHA2 family multidrug resistance protein